jgi:hypothetical protein
MGSRYLEMGKTEEGAETLVALQLNSPKNSKIPRRNQKISNGGLESFYTVVLESWGRMRVKG